MRERYRNKINFRFSNPKSYEKLRCTKENFSVRNTSTIYFFIAYFHCSMKIVAVEIIILVVK